MMVFGEKRENVLPGLNHILKLKMSSIAKQMLILNGSTMAH